MNKIFLAILLFIFFSPLQVVYGGWFHTDGGLIKDSTGNIVILRSVNMYIRIQALALNSFQTSPLRETA